MPRLFVVPTPIGNLEDITLRALRVLRDVPLVLAEDTRHTRRLLTHYDISTPLLSYHQHNKRARLEAVLRALQEKDVALVSSAGMPSVSDPGFELIEAAWRAGVEIDVLPGANAAITAVVAAAMAAPGFLFAGFLPRRSGERQRRLAELAEIPYSLVLYEAPHRLLSLLQDLQSMLGDRQLAVARELTKLHQEVLHGRISEMIDHFASSEPRGEFTVVVAPAGSPAESRADEVLEELRRRRSRGENVKTAVAAVESTYGVTRNEAYRLWLDAQEE